MTAPFLGCQSLGLVRPGRPAVLSGIGLTLDCGELVGLLGLNGAGKSTLMRLLAGLMRPTTGEVWLEGKDMRRISRTAVARRLAYVPQSHAAMFPFSVRRMVELGRLPYSGLYSRLAEADHMAVDRALDRLGLHDLADRSVMELSGGERQRVVLARALAQETRALLLDEPMTGLDYGHQLRLMELLGELAVEGRLILLTSHRPEELYAQASRILILDDGRISADGAPADVVTAAGMSALYDVSLSQVDCGRHRFFRHGEDRT
ncbi:ABC transporter ATP-binding protein [Gluconobacter morbifer]|uniref:ABC-type Fe3+-siderophore transport system, ATP-binding protein n=1 Tax=Gluconobacter morbifer G707 TaxID=1088869 RepID=G6XF86_9PROT|nr:ABC transporter ATP-binding protein [Gluconobacter morbifer]EHH68844.1 ABC-type Fe3+-siderophore transport system, ATP-binding protein [Gluconobacter morbifer G707]